MTLALVILASASACTSTEQPSGTRGVQIAIPASLTHLSTSLHAVRFSSSGAKLDHDERARVRSAFLDDGSLEVWVSSLAGDPSTATATRTWLTSIGVPEDQVATARPPNSTTFEVWSADGKVRFILSTDNDGLSDSDAVDDSTQVQR